MIFLCLGILKLMYLVFTNIHTMKKLVLSIFMISALAVNAQEIYWVWRSVILEFNMKGH